MAETATGGATRSLSLVQAVGEAMRQAMELDPTVIVMGEDVVGGAGRGGDKENTMGGSFGATKSLFEHFGPERVRDTPISEAGFVGAGVGAAAAGLRPVIDLMWADFTPLAFDQIYNQASKMAYMFGGQARVPLTIRVAMGSGLSAAAQHSDTLYSLFTHVPGLRVVVPSTAYDAKGLLLESIFDDSPVIFFEHLRLYVARGEVPEAPYRIPLGVAEVRRPGTDVTLVGIAATVGIALEAAEQLAGEGISAEVIDPRTLSPLDADALVASVEKTGTMVVIDESPPRCSIATDIAAIVGERAFDYLDAPIRRVTSPHAPVPFSPPLERAYMPSVESVVAAVHSVL
jgi:pyruvate/2-oxoglutarate/acetoin dehydrogenase E1 component